MPDAYLRFTVGRPDKAQIPAKPITIPILSYELAGDVEAGAAIAAPDGLDGQGGPASQSFTVSVSPHVLTSPLADSLKSGKQLESLALVVERPDTDAAFKEYDFSVAYVRSIGWSDPNGDKLPSEIITFEYGAVQAASGA